MKVTVNQLTPLIVTVEFGRDPQTGADDGELLPGLVILTGGGFDEVIAGALTLGLDVMAQVVTGNAVSIDARQIDCGKQAHA